MGSPNSTDFTQFATADKKDKTKPDGAPANPPTPGEDKIAEREAEKTDVDGKKPSGPDAG